MGTPEEDLEKTSRDSLPGNRDAFFSSDIKPPGGSIVGDFQYTMGDLNP